MKMKKPNITKSQLKKIINEEVQKVMQEARGGRTARVDYDEGGIRVSDAFLSFEDIEGTKANPRSGDEIEGIILDFFEENDVTAVRDVEDQGGNIDPQEWLDTMLMNHPAGGSRRPPEHSGGGHSVRDLEKQGIDSSDRDAF